jgi:hypothetical protein
LTLLDAGILDGNLYDLGFRRQPLIAWPASVFRCETAITQTTVFRLD